MDNEQPWQPPQPQDIPEIPKTTPEVPDVTLYSPGNKLPNRVNFLERARVMENVPSNLKPPPSRNLNNPLFSNPSFNRPSKPLVPDVSLHNPQALNPTSRMNKPIYTKSPSNMLFPKTTKLSSKENFFGLPSVPDVTILDELPRPETSNPNEPVFSESYKQMLITSHEQFMKQIQQEKSPSAEPTNQPKKKSALFNPPTNNYQENPLRKYAPNPPPPRTFDSDPHGPHNSSSILMDAERPAASSSGSTSDDKTFKKVADMLNKIEKLAIPEQTKPDKRYEKTEKSSEPHEIMRNLASNYLSPEEREFYEVEKELEELQVEERDDDDNEGM